MYGTSLYLILFVVYVQMLSLSRPSLPKLFYVLRATSAKLGMHVGNMKFSTQNEG